MTKKEKLVKMILGKLDSTYTPNSAVYKRVEKALLKKLSNNELDNLYVMLLS